MKLIKGIIIAVFLLCFLFSPLTKSSSAALFFDNMENGINDWSATGMWHQVSQGSDTYAEAHSSTTSWWYGQDSTGNYDNGSTNYGFLTSPSINIPGTGYELHFWAWFQTEASSSYDQKIIQISIDGGAFSNIFQIVKEK